MTRLGLIANPLSQRNKRGLPALRRAVEAHPGLIDYVELDGMDSLGPALRRFAEERHPLVALAGGDGTIVAAVGEYLLRQPELPRPALAILPAGMTNMTAADIGLSGRPDRALARLAALFGEGDDVWRRRCIQRPPLLVSGGGMAKPQAGFFLGGGGVCNAIEFCREKVHRLGFEAEWANGVTLASLLLRQAFGGNLLLERPLAWRWDGGERREGAFSVILATTLDRLVVGTRPFWNQAVEPEARDGFSVSLIHKTGATFWLKLPQLLYGPADRRLDLVGCHSGPARLFELWMNDSFTIDGEIFTASAEEALNIERGSPLTFVKA